MDVTCIDCKEDVPSAPRRPRAKSKGQSLQTKEVCEAIEFCESQAIGSAVEQPLHISDSLIYILYRSTSEKNRTSSDTSHKTARHLTRHHERSLLGVARPGIKASGGGWASARSPRRRLQFGAEGVDCGSRFGETWVPWCELPTCMKGFGQKQKKELPHILRSLEAHRVLLNQTIS